MRAARIREFDSEITLCCKVLKTRGIFAWLGIWDDFRNFLVTAA